MAVSKKITSISSRKSRKTGGKSIKRKAGSGDKSDEQVFLRSREKLNKKRLLRDRSTHWAHFWNVCPKCGGDMFEQKTGSIFFEVCRKCHGLYVDKAELELIIKFKDPKKMLRALLKKAKDPVIKI